ncbi:hypothetical protein GGP41_004431 [Bipolaris sorokiniana]|uniref:Heterokaryon incompatibility domain-containing protein n=2 Tax=Cochliobolus sativus TaxID=45130 RepID=A0A8H5ZLG8_COCSA|nr:uncharacterized protein COCSADRAFT_251062 [Bipolaris sorokiniana ND90Pr]EMD59529.1 hypothetical protein COCSADRAFT_251062 [Bipolaris sorokiniana ND90Pr]KAF5851542.1 hypothetical protein GGP41_004431 [Bipolaris sorokiniana]
MSSWDPLLPPWRPPLWRPPQWWATDSNSKDGSRGKKIKDAYAKAKKCTLCNNFVWPTEGVEFRIDEWSSSAKGGCAGCMVLCAVATLIEYTIESPEQSSPIGSMRFKMEHSRILATSDWRYGYDVYSPHMQQNPWEIPYFPPELEVASYSGSSHAIKRTLSWLRACDETHQSCRRTTSPLPSRVVLIQGPQNIKLHESNGETEPYACLSHCWGKKHIIRTTTSNLSLHKQQIKWSRLPLTFRHAVSFAYRLGLKYLWIDSLCIIQDDVDDWRREGSKMAQIYSGAYITLAATASRDASGGCFRHGAKRSLFRLSYPDEKGSKLDLYVRPRLKNASWVEGRAPLVPRGWTLQERLLSPRVLYFTHEELVWDCKTKNDCECSIPPPFALLSNMCSLSWLNDKLHVTNGDDHSDSSKTWHTIIEQYTQQRLTYEKDVFPALQGISKMFSIYTKSRYLAGLWENTVISDLLWMRYSGIRRRPQIWRAPSWSWASVVGDIYWDSQANNKSFRALATCIAVEVQPVNADAFGEIASASLTLRARCFSKAAQEPWLPLTYPRQNMVPYVDLEGPAWSQDGVGAAVNLDCKVPEFDPTRPQSKMLGLEMRIRTVVMAQYYSEDYNFTKFDCLLLRKTAEKREQTTYERFGYLKMQARDVHLDASELPLDEEEILYIV